MSDDRRPKDYQGEYGGFFPVDVTDGSAYTVPLIGASRGGFLTEMDDLDNAPSPGQRSMGWFEPRNWRLSKLPPEIGGREDQRLEIQTIVDYEGPHDEDDEPPPFYQAGSHSSINRSTRVIDGAERVALRTSRERVIDSEDGRYAMADTCRVLSMEEALEPELLDPTDDAGFGLPPGVRFFGPNTQSDSGGTITAFREGVSLGGLTFFGGASVQAAAKAFQRGGSTQDAIRWARAALAGQSFPPLQDATPGDDSTRTRPPPPPINPEGSVNPHDGPPMDYVWTPGEGGRVGLKGTFWAPEQAAGSYFPGSEGTPIGPLPMRHDAQITMGQNKCGRIHFVANDIAAAEEGNGKLFKGAMYSDSGLANQNTEVGLETTQWRPAIRVTFDLPPRTPPPPMTGGGGSRTDPTRVRSPRPETGGEEPPGGGGPPTGGGGEPEPEPEPEPCCAPAGGGMPEGAGDDGENIDSADVPDGDTVTGGPGEGAGQTAPRCSVVPPREGIPVGDGGYSELISTPVANAQSQRRDPTNKVPCMNSTKGTLLPDGTRTDYGYDPVQIVPGWGLVMGGFGF